MYAIEGINSLSDPMKNIPDAPNTQKMHRTIIPHSCTSVSYNVVHILLARTEGPSDSCAEESVLVYEGRALVSQILVNTTLYDPVQSLRSGQMNKNRINGLNIRVQKGLSETLDG